MLIRIIWHTTRKSTPVSAKKLKKNTVQIWEGLGPQYTTLGQWKNKIFHLHLAVMTSL